MTDKTYLLVERLQGLLKDAKVSLTYSQGFWSAAINAKEHVEKDECRGARPEQAFLALLNKVLMSRKNYLVSLEQQIESKRTELEHLLRAREENQRRVAEMQTLAEEARDA